MIITTITEDGTRECARGDCKTRHDSVRSPYCPGHRGRNATRNNTRAVARNLICEHCSKPFEADSTRQKACQACRASHNLRANGQPVNPGYKPARFIAVDGEGTGRGKDHRYVLLGVGQEQREWPDGVTDITEIFSFLYEQFRANPDAAFVGFFLGYDFNMWLRLLPRERAWMLLNPAGMAKRARKVNPQAGPFPVEYRGWEFDMLAMKRFKLKPVGERYWMSICDSGPFFQTSLLTAINPRKWNDPIVTPEEYALIKQGKERRDSAALDDDMRMYNRLENDILARLMHSLDTGLSHANVHLDKRQWFGPGQAAQAWMRLNNKLEVTTKAVRALPQRIQDAAVATYYGGWFEIPVHGHVPGITYEYDINSAYPSIASRLPCLCGKWTSGKNRPRAGLSHRWMTGHAKTPRDRTLRMVHAMVQGKDKYLGPLPYRLDTGHIRRPLIAEGWYWQHEIDAARKAGLITDVHYLDWHEYQPCQHEEPLRQLNGLYESRLRIGKDTPEGKAFKLVYNSVYGKLAQSQGEPVYANPVYASLITSGCRTMVLHAIATHPAKSAAVVMVATDGVYFMSPHPGLDAKVSENMGDWSREERHNLTTFKPGVYWDDEAREAIAHGEAPEFKSRGVSARAFAGSIAEVDRIYSTWTPEQPGVWPKVEFTAGFVQYSVIQALQWTEKTPEDRQTAVYRNVAGRIQESKKLSQDSFPGGPTGKRHAGGLYYDAEWKVYRTSPYPGSPGEPSKPYDKRFGLDADEANFNGYMSPDAPVALQFRQALGVG